MPMNTLRLQLRFLVPLGITLVAAAYLALPLMDRLTLRWYSRDLTLRGTLVANALSDSVAQSLAHPAAPQLQTLLNRAVQDERLVAIGLCSLDGRLLNKTAGFPASLDCSAAQQTSASAEPLMQLPSGSVQVGFYPVQADAGAVANLVLLHDHSFIDRRSQDTRRYLVGLIAVLGGTIAIITVVVAQLSWRGWISGTRALLRGEGLLRPLLSPKPELAPIAADLRNRLRDLEDEIRRASGASVPWNPERLRSLLRTTLRGDEIIVVSNREPYIHEATPDGIVVKRPASGLVTAVEPVMRACSGTWIAHGSGSADRLVVDASDHVPLPPGSSEYTLRCIWLTAEEEQGYYYGFANEGLWPLCHVAHVRPVFRESDWNAYQVVNQRFADAVVREARSEDPVVLVQDYHFALLPAMIRARLPRATILSFWHIPWPNPESFGICPWRREILEGMLGSTILGFQTRFHCKNFIETVDRYVEARIEHEHSIISYQNEDTFVESYPISIEWPLAAAAASQATVERCRARVFERLGMTADQKLAVGIDRLDYTKGILEHGRGRAPVREASAMDRVPRLRPGGRALAGGAGRVPHVPRAPGQAGRPHQRAFRQPGLPAGAPAGHAPRARSRDGTVPRRRCLPGDEPARRDEPSLQGVRRGPRRRARGAGAEQLRRRRARDDRSADRQPLPCGRMRRRLAACAGHARSRTARTHGQPAHDGARIHVYRWAGRMLADAGRWRMRQRVEARVQRHHVA